MEDKITTEGKEKLKKQINKWISNISKFVKDYGLIDKDDCYQEVINIVLSYANDENIVSWNSVDPDTCEFMGKQINRLYEEVEYENSNTY